MGWPWGRHGEHTSRAGQIPAQMGQTSLQPVAGGEGGGIRLLLSPRTGAGQSEASDLGASAKSLLVP